MTITSPSPVTAHDVVVQIVDSHSRIASMMAIVYTDQFNWIDRVEQAQLTPSKLKAGVSQDAGLRLPIEVSRREILGGRLKQIEKELSPNQLLGITSRVRLTGNQTKQIPMMDFRCRVNEENLRTLSRLLPEIGQSHGFILQSGRSYHFYGQNLLTQRAWSIFLGKCLLMKTFSDDRYVGHQLVDGHCVLRLSTSKLKPHRPTVAVAF